ncbi:hypothetical protein ACFLIM_40175 [Nonomuraea sp. M3C6]|uniref:Uncharacterized protein n=1 Tax=Nonomuraea marmarensis TaxID=3351344 RepID=A0ABW7APY3_9ACTN
MARRPQWWWPGGHHHGADGTDGEAPGIQHAYGNLTAPTPELEQTTYTDHDALVIRAGLPK